MTDYGQSLRFGYFLVPEPGTPTISTAQHVDRLGLELLAIQDHTCQRSFGDTLVMMGAILSATSRVHVMPDLACLPLRPPAALARTIATLDGLHGGRAELSLGGGAFWDAAEAFGGPRMTPGEARAALSDAIHVIRLTWTGLEGMRFDGEHYRLSGAQAGPVPAHPISISLGVTGRDALTLAGEMADGWLPWSSFVPPGQLCEGHRIIDEAAQGAFREPTAVRRLYHVQGVITERTSGGFLQGSVTQWADELAELALDHGIDTFIFGGDPAQLSSFACEVAPAARELVTKERSGSRSH
jgi:alkanesulfonate monooxygenase SsuD/methylene tetrahydromethanopterin reductase-like flavin-dependent oxidoreductase (luciferase family)